MKPTQEPNGIGGSVEMQEVGDDSLRGYQGDGGSLPEPPRQDLHYIKGWKLHVITAALGLALFLVNFEVTVVSTALVSISNSLGEFDRSSWIVTAYLITYTAGLVILAKISDLMGRKSTYTAALLIFAAFSGACGGARTMVQLIILRAFQGVGAAGVYAVALVMLYELVPKSKYPLYTAIVTGLATLGNALGPVLGGVISREGGSTWRWVFYLNVPTSICAAIVVTLMVPSNFPYQGLDRRQQRPTVSWRSVDFAGAFLMLLALALVITGLEEAASRLSFGSAAVLGPLIAGIVGWVGFLLSQWFLSQPGQVTQPVFPWRFVTNRIPMGLLLNSFLTGSVSITCIIQLPIRYQTTIGADPLEAGIRLLPFVLFGPPGATVLAVACKNRRVPPMFMGLVGVILQILGLIFLGRGPPDTPNWTPIYACEVFTGLGMGLCIGLVTLMMPFVVESRDLAIASAAGTQFRFLGSAVVVSITTAVGNGWIKDRLLGTLSQSQVDLIFVSTDSISDLSPQLQTVVRQEFVRSFNLEMHIVLGFAVASLLSIALLWKKPMVRID